MTAGALSNWGRIEAVYERGGKTARLYRCPQGVQCGLDNVGHILTITEIGRGDTFNITSPTANSVLCEKLVNNLTVEGLTVSFSNR
ncbi:hypothetical protein HYU95_03705 [Candidatus Daviesbacteria bacterium]|nr:hypothetical protein [Candidatus Daviesbacteria bacterium]